MPVPRSLPGPRPDPILAGRDPALAMLRAVARTVSGGAPVAVGRRREGMCGDTLDHIDLDAIAARAVGHYRSDRTYPGVVIGSPNGAMAQLCGLTGMPWLPQTVTVPVQWSSSPQPAPDEALRAGARTAEAVLERNPDVGVHQVFGDQVVPSPGQRVSSFRCKQLRLPPAYRRFLREVLAPGAPVIVLADESRWPVTATSERHLFQVGCRRAQAVEERASGRRSGSASHLLPARQQGDVATVDGPLPDGMAPEAEWGLDPELVVDVAAWAARTGHPLRHIRIPDPQALSAPVADLSRSWARRDGLAAWTLTVSTAAPLMAGIAGHRHVPYWLAPPLRQALTGLVGYLSRARYEAIEVQQHPVGERDPGYQEWRRLVECVERVSFFAGRRPLADRQEFPASRPEAEVADALDALRQRGTSGGVQVSS